MLASDGGAPAPRRPAARTTSSITGSPRPSHDRRLARFFVGSPRTVGPQPHDVLRLALPAPSQARLGGRTTGGSHHFLYARLGRWGPSPTTSYGSHYPLHHRLASAVNASAPTTKS